jgi:hypothetical protein
MEFLWESSASAEWASSGIASPVTLLFLSSLIRGTSEDNLPLVLSLILAFSLQTSKKSQDGVCEHPKT